MHPSYISEIENLRWFALAVLKLSLTTGFAVWLPALLYFEWRQGHARTLFTLDRKRHEVVQQVSSRHAA